MRIVPLGDQAVLVYLADEPAAIRFAAAITSANPDWLQAVVPAYASVGVFFDADRIKAREIAAFLASIEIKVSALRTKQLPHTSRTASPSVTRWGRTWAAFASTPA